jgi:hypothetical protein
VLFNEISENQTHFLLYQEPGFYMFKCPDDNIDAGTDVSEPENHSPDLETNTMSGGRLATPMNFAPVRVDRSPGKLTCTDYMTIADLDEDLIDPKPKGRKATPSVKKNVMPTKATPITILMLGAKTRIICIHYIYTQNKLMSAILK